MPEVHALIVFDVAQEIDLDACERILGGPSQRPALRHRGRASTLFQYRPAPLRVAQEAVAVQVGRWPAEPVVDVTLYDFGAAAVAYEIPVEGGLEQLREISLELRQSPDLKQDARRRIDSLLGSLSGAITKAKAADLTEDYLMFGLQEVPEGREAAPWCEAMRREIAGILRPDGPISTDEIQNATELSISFGPSDVTIVDWDAAFVLDPDPEDVRAVLEFANVQLLEMRWLDLQIDEAVERSYKLHARGWSWRDLTPLPSRDLREVVALQLDSSVLLERVTNSLKVFGEEYLARIYRLAARRFRLDELDHSLTRKLETIESIYQKMNDRADRLRMEILEWVVIVLIAVEVALSLRGH